MTEAERAALMQSAHDLASAVQSGNASAVQALTIAKVKAQFDPIANTIEQTAPLLAGATITIDALYGLDASDLKTAAEDTVFFCGVANSPLHVERHHSSAPKRSICPGPGACDGSKAAATDGVTAAEEWGLATRRIVREADVVGRTR